MNWMQKITESVYQIKTPMGEHFVNCFLVLGEDRAVLIDTGLSETYRLIREAMGQLGLTGENLFAVLITHGHPDHIGANFQLTQSFDLSLIAPTNAVPWIEDHECQFREFPAAFPQAFQPDQTFKDFWMDLMDDEAQVDIAFDGSITLKLAANHTLTSLPFPGHSMHETGYYESSSKCLVLGDAIVLDHPAGFPAYEDPKAYRDSLIRILAMVKARDVAVLVSGHYDPLDRDEAERLVISSLDRVNQIENVIIEILIDAKNGLPLRVIGELVASKIERTYNFQTPWTVFGHLKNLKERGVVCEENELYHVLE
jgi:glyoxylase-like metal-dependent hydrolase (beta-lactamase superfamily II)